jgi:hypothetical protein
VSIPPPPSARRLHPRVPHTPESPVLVYARRWLRTLGQLVVRVVVVMAVFGAIGVAAHVYDHHPVLTAVVALVAVVTFFTGLYD